MSERQLWPLRKVTFDGGFGEAMVEVHGWALTVLREMDFVEEKERPGLDAVEEAEVIHKDQIDALLSILANLWCEAQVSALERVAKEMCRLCRDGEVTRFDGRVYGSTPGQKGDWIHGKNNGGGYQHCLAPKVWDALSRLRKG